MMFKHRSTGSKQQALSENMSDSMRNTRVIDNDATNTARRNDSTTPVDLHRSRKEKYEVRRLAKILPVIT